MNEQNAVATKDDVADMLNGMLPQIRAIAPKWFSAERITQMMLTARTATPALKECSTESVVGFMMKCAQSGIDQIGPGGAWPVPFRNKHTGRKEVVFVPDYRGLIYVAKKNDVIVHAYADIVRGGDEFSIEKGDTPRCIHRPALKNRGDMVGAYAIAVLPDGTKHIEWMDLEELEKVRNSSKAKDEGPWHDWREEQYKKTVLKRALKVFAGGNPRLQTAIDLDNDALGLKNLDRAPIPPPVALDPKEVTVGEPQPPKPEPTATKPPENTPNPPPSTPKSPPNPTPAEPPPHEVTGTEVKLTVGNVGSKPTKTGKVRYYFKGSDGEWYNSFNKSVGKCLPDLKGKEVIVEYKETQYGRDILNIRMPDEPAAAQNPSDDLPFN